MSLVSRVLIKKAYISYIKQNITKTVYDIHINFLVNSRYVGNKVSLATKETF